MSRDLLAEAILFIEKSGFRVAHHVYDSIIAVAREEDQDRAYKVVCEALTRCPSWATGWPMGVEASITRRYE
jgi:DNA polymerase